MLTPLKFHRLTKDIKSSDLANKSNISVSMLSKMEAGITRGSKKTRKNISVVLDIPEKILFGGK